MATILASRVEALRRARGLSQRALAEASGITRQAVGAIESGGMQPGVGIALKLARALDTTVEELFGNSGTPEPKPARVASATIAGRTVAHRLDADHLAIEPAESLLATVFVAGCELAAGLLSRHAMARSRDARVLWLNMTNRAALGALARGEVHAAVLHGASKGARSENLARFELASSEAGWLAARGNPLGLGSARDLVRKKARLVNRPTGAGARDLLDEQLRRSAIDPAALSGYARELPGQLDAGRAVAHGFADAAIGMASVAHLFGLAFVPLREERLSLVVPPENVPTPEVRALLDALRSTPFRRDLQALETYDVTKTGEQVA